MAGPVTDPRAGLLRGRYHALFADPELPVPVDRIAEDLLGLHVATADLKELSGALYPAEREIRVKVMEPETRRRFTLAHELGHWVCHCLGGGDEPVFCRHQDMDRWVDRALEREANVFAAELMMPGPEVREVYTQHGGREGSSGDLRRIAARDALAPLQLRARRHAPGAGGRHGTDS